MMVGGRDFSLYGRPLLPQSLVQVHARVVEKTLSHCRIHFRYRRRENYRKMKCEARIIQFLWFATSVTCTVLLFDVALNPEPSM